MDQSVNNIAFAPASELRDLIATKQVSPVEVTELYYDRIENLDPKLNAYTLEEGFDVDSDNP